MPGITDLGAQSAQESREERESDNQSDFDPQDWYDQQYDISGLSWVKIHPTTAIRGVAKSLQTFNVEEENYQRGYYGLVLEDPSVVVDDDELEGTVIFEGTKEKGDDFKIVNADDEQTTIIESGVDFSGNLFYGEEVDALEDDEMVLKLSGGAGRSTALALDVKGSGGAHSVGAYEDEDVELHDGGFPVHSGHAVEYHPDGRDGEMPRNARDFELRPDVEGKEVIVMIQRLADIDEEYDGGAYWSTVLVETEDADDAVFEIDGTAFESIEPTDEFEPSEDNIRAQGFISWNRVDIVDLNQARIDEGFDPYLPNEMDREEVLPDDLDADDFEFVESNYSGE